MLEHLYVDNVDLTTYGAFIFDRCTLDAPEREYTFYNVPSRDGALVGSQTRLKNINIEYYFVINSNAETNLKNLRSFLLSREGYVRIEDSGHSGEFRMGVYRGKMQVKATRNRDMVKGVIVFNCMPQRWLTSGETTVTINAGDGLNTLIGTNPSPFSSKPIIEVFGDGFFTINGVKVTVDAISGASSVVIDCDTMACTYVDGYGAKHDAAYAVGFTDTSGVYDVDAPLLITGTNRINATNTYFTVTKIVITPRWWEV